MFLVNFVGKVRVAGLKVLLIERAQAAEKLSGNRATARMQHQEVAGQFGISPEPVARQFYVLRLEHQHNRQK